ncbi:MAG: hypothetical protein AAGA67_09680, partial [Cyanobacteria bacterium P01_F01_bin.153]
FLNLLKLIFPNGNFQASQVINLDIPEKGCDGETVKQSGTLPRKLKVPVKSIYSTHLKKQGTAEIC